MITTETTTTNTTAIKTVNEDNVIFMTMTMSTTMAGERVYSDKDDDKDPNGKDNDNLIF